MLVNGVQILNADTVTNSKESVIISELYFISFSVNIKRLLFWRFLVER